MTTVRRKTQRPTNNETSINQGETNEQGVQNNEIPEDLIETRGTQGTYEETTERPNSTLREGDIQGISNEDTEMTNCPIEPGDILEKQRQIDVVKQALADTREPPQGKYKDLHTKLVSLLNNARENPELITQTLLDDVYAQVLTQITTYQKVGSTKQKRARGPKTQNRRKRARKRYNYARTQDLFRKNLNLLARYIREDIPWLEDETLQSSTPDRV